MTKQNNWIKIGYNKGYQNALEKYKKDYLKMRLEKQRAELIKEFEKMIDEEERRNWDCSLPCGLVNNDTDKCKICNTPKEKSWDNGKLEDIKKQLQKLKEKK